MTRGPQQPSLEKEAVKPKIERASGIVKSSVGDKTAGEPRWVFLLSRKKKLLKNGD